MLGEKIAKKSEIRINNTQTWLLQVMIIPKVKCSPLPDGTHEAGVFLEFLSLRPGIVNIQFAIDGQGKYNFHTVRIEYAVANEIVCDRLACRNMLHDGRQSKQ